MEALQTFVINLDRAPQRLQRISEQLAGLQLGWTRLPAVDAQQLSPQQQAALDEPAYRRKHGKTPLPGELGCYLSHLAVMHAFLASGASAALVLEDDVLLRPTLPAVLRGLLAQPARWDVVKLSAVHSGTPVPVGTAAPGHALAVMLSRCTGSSAYLMNRRAAEVYARRLLPMSLPYDHVFDQAWRFGLKLRLVTPTPCEHDEETASMIGTPAGPPRKFHWTRRLPAHLYRLGNEVQRLGYGIGQVLRERM